MEGTRYVEIPADSIMGLLTEIGQKVAAKGGGMGETVVWRERVVDLQPAQSKTVVRVFTSLARGEDAVRGCGEDAVRIVIGFIGRARDGQERFFPLTDGRRIYRTAPTQLAHEKRVEAFLDRFKVALREVYDDARKWTACPACGAPMQIRTNKGNSTKFWGCTAFPGCRGTRPA